MSIINAYTTNIGQKKANQDSLLSLRAMTKRGQIAMAVVCDGMGGHAKGELASKEVIYAFRNWFTKSLPIMIYDGISPERVFDSWQRLLSVKNQLLVNLGKSIGAMIGTTVAAVLIIENQFFIINVGDSRIYSITDDSINILTRDQTLVMLHVESGEIRYEDMESDPRRSILLQCVGATESLEPEFGTGFIDRPTVFLSCSDGFRHLISIEEMLNWLRPLRQNDEEALAKNIISIQHTVLDRGEQDNVTAVALCVK